MPFEREDTAMAEFPLCEPCEHEYRTPGRSAFSRPDDGLSRYADPHVGDVPGNRSDSRIRLGNYRPVEIVALRGLGGYQLLVDATDEAAVQRLRTRKGRRAKPLAVMVESFARGGAAGGVRCGGARGVFATPRRRSCWCGRRPPAALAPASNATSTRWA